MAQTLKALSHSFAPKYLNFGKTSTSEKKTNYNVHNITSNNPAKQTIHKRGKQGHLK